MMDDVETEAGFLEDRDPDDYPSVLRITSDSERRSQGALDRLDRWEAVEEVPHIINFQNRVTSEHCSPTVASNSSVA